jgi:uncharacterized membrane protein
MHDADGLERSVSIAAGGLLVALGARLIYRGAAGYRVFPRNPYAAVPYGTGVRVEESIDVAAPAKQIYAYWRRLETLPQFMSHLEEVTTLTNTRSRWRVQAPVGSPVTWEAQIINDIPGRLIGWRSLPGSRIHHAGSVHFDQHDGITSVRVVLEYAPPGRYLGASVARFLGEDPQRQIAQDLRRFKDIVERGERANLR